ncbi:MAG: DUF2726 domain-containing protein [Planctomycetota bacterium]|jgi:hypothetical protein|nr:DUF2726 domain-containing protein [Planctomycetota bacterium]
MLDLIGSASLSEVVLLFEIIFILPLIAYLLVRLRKYEARLAGDGDDKKKKKKKEPEKAAPAKADKKPAVPADVFPYQTKSFMDPTEKSCLESLSEALGGDTRIYLKVALSELVQSTDPNPGFQDRLSQRSVDFLVCDGATGKPLSAICFEPGKKTPTGQKDDLVAICQAAGLPLVFIPQQEKYDVKKLREALNIPDLSL